MPMKSMVEFLDWEKDGLNVTVTDAHLIEFSNKIYYGSDRQQEKATLPFKVNIRPVK